MHNLLHDRVFVKEVLQQSREVFTFIIKQLGACNCYPTK